MFRIKRAVFFVERQNKAVIIFKCQILFKMIDRSIVKRPLQTLTVPPTSPCVIDPVIFNFTLGLSLKLVSLHPIYTNLYVSPSPRYTN